MLDLSMAMVVSGLVVGGLGFVLFVWGRRQGDLGALTAGIVLSVLTLVVHSVLSLWLGCGAVLGGLWLVRRLGGGGMV